MAHILGTGTPAVVLSRSMGNDTGASRDDRLAVAEVMLAHEAEGVMVGRAVRDPGGRIVDLVIELANPVSESVLGLGPLRGERLLSVLPDVQARMFPLFVDVIESGRPRQGVVQLSTPGLPELDGRWFEQYLAACGDVLVCRYRDVTSERQAAEALALSEQRFRSLVEHAADVIVVLDESGRNLYASPAIETVLGYGQTEVIGLHYLTMIDPADHAKAEHAFAGTLASPGALVDVDLLGVAKDGSKRWLAVRASSHLDDPAVGGVVVNWRDVTERYELHQRLAEQALHDPLTGLPNRRLFADHVDLALARAQRSAPLAVLFCDVDHFKLVNDTLGHEAGDDLIREIAVRLRGAVRPMDTVARFGGDEFVVLCEGLHDETMVANIAERIHRTVAGRYQVRGVDTHVTLSIGVTTAGPNATRELLLSEADAAMYEAKRRGRDRLELFSGRLRHLVAHRLQTESGLRAALSEDRFHLLYQPILDLRTGRVAAAEALLRWADPQHGIRPPADFLPVAEETGLIVDIGAWVLNSAFAQAAKWAAAGRNAPVVHVNLSARQLAHPDLLSQLDSALDSTGIDPSRVELEITESLLLDDVDRVAQLLAAVRQRGFRIALDDFGVGYSSLHWLRRLPVDALKLDQTLIAGLIATDRPAANGRAVQDRNIASSMIQLAHALELRVVAEGIETAEQFDVLTSLGADLGQGHHIGRPKPAADLPLP